MRCNSLDVSMETMPFVLAFGRSSGDCRVHAIHVCLRAGMDGASRRSIVLSGSRVSQSGVRSGLAPCDHARVVVGGCGMSVPPGTCLWHVRRLDRLPVRV